MNSYQRLTKTKKRKKKYLKTMNDAFQKLNFFNFFEPKTEDVSRRATVLKGFF